MLGEVNQIYHLYAESKKYYKWMYMHNRNRLIYRKQTSGYQKEEENGEKQVRGMGLRNTNYYV